MHKKKQCVSKVTHSLKPLYAKILVIMSLGLLDPLIKSYYLCHKLQNQGTTRNDDIETYTK